MKTMSLQRTFTLTAAFLLATIMHAASDNERILTTMKTATRYMMDSVSYRGGFVWSLLPDRSRRWGEMEAWPQMIWMQAPSTPEVGEVLLDAYHATGDNYYYEQACRVAEAIMEAQKPCGGWHYMHNFAGEKSTQKWYATVGKQAWRLEEFQHYYGNATFDDDATFHPAYFMLRIYLEKREARFLHSLNKAIDFVVKSQYDNGGWSQRYPLKTDPSFGSTGDYTPRITINDGVMENNIDFLVACYQTLNRPELKESVERAMHCLRDLQYKTPYAGWTDQYDEKTLLPAPARSYEPRSINTGTTVGIIRRMIQYYQMTGDKSFLAGLDKAVHFLQAQALPDSMRALWGYPPRDGSSESVLVPRYIDPETGKPLFVHRVGSNVRNGHYYTDQDIRNTLQHYSSATYVNIPRLQAMIKAAAELPIERWDTVKALPAYYFRQDDRGFRGRRTSVEQLIASLTPEGYWLTPIGNNSNPYKPLPANMPTTSRDSTYMTTMCGDEYDTSPYPDHTTLGISTAAFVQNMTTLIAALRKDVAASTTVGLEKVRFQAQIDGKQTDLFVLKNNSGAEVCITNYGARIVSICVPNRFGALSDVVLGFDNVADYHRMKQNYGATVGRYLGRITGARLVLDGKEYQLQNYGKGDISHGGRPGFADRVWDIVACDRQQLTLRYVSPDGENGFPGTLSLTLTIMLTDDNTVALDYKATTDRPTVLNPSNHSFFNLSGNHSQSIENELLWINADSIATYNCKKQMTGQFMAVAGTAFDFSLPQTIGAHIDDNDAQLKVTGGYDHAWQLKTVGDISQPALRVSDSETGIRMTVYTTEPAVQIYTGNGLKGNTVGKNQTAYPRRSAVCFETCHYADSPNQPQFPSTVLRPGETFHSQTRFHFDIIK